MNASRSSTARTLIRLTALVVVCLVLAVAGLRVWEAIQAARMRAATQRLRAMYFSEDYEGARIEGARLARQFPEASELNAWHLLGAGARGGPNNHEARAVARRMT